MCSRYIISSFLLTAVLTAALVVPLVVAQDSLQVYLRDGGKAMLNKEFGEAIKNYNNALRFDSNNVQALKNLGVSCSSLGDQKKARIYLERAYKINSLDPGLNNDLGVLYSGEGNSNEAIKYFEMAVRLDTNKALYLTNLGQEYFKANRISLALPVLRRAQELEPDKGVIQYTLGNCFAASNSLDSAEFYYERSVANGGKTSQLFYFLGSIERRLGKMDKAEQSFKQALVYDTRHRDCLQSLGMLYLSQQRYPETAEQARRVIAIDSADYAGWILLGTAYTLDDMPERADSILKRLFAVDSGLGFQMLDFIATESQKKQGKPKE